MAWLRRKPGLPVNIYRVDPITDKREPFRIITPAEPGGVEEIAGFKFARDGSYGYSYNRILSKLYVIDGLK